MAQIGAAALEVPIFRSANMSLGINVLLELVKKAASVLGDSYDIEIVGGTTAVRWMPPAAPP